ncbi:hypothetical protein D9619_013352 [Psilocybe cf. subviscida]|uniref:Neprosin domain-containing protein n=1 Tax=Psilocybe cf. subviscida TaxID=2480587 RepID=A0A8H5BRQ6_9AGAR|nr:hypothetical protein D9619_013352 [Psilocybe cf. subviscida]
MLFKSLLGFALLGSALATSVLPRDQLSPNPSNSVVQEHQNAQRRDASPSPVVRMTNAERMVAGMPPLPPRRRGSRTSNAARSAPSPGGSGSHGYIAAKEAGGDTLLGYFTRAYNNFGEHGLTDPSKPVDGALKVVLPCASERNSPFNIEAEDPVQGSYPFVGMMKGWANDNPNLGPGSFNYVFFGGVQQSPSHSTPVDQSNTFTAATGIAESTESAVWHYDDVSGKLTPQWINTDDSIPAVYYGIYLPDHAVFATGDKTKFSDTFGAGNIQWLDLYYVNEA